MLRGQVKNPVTLTYLGALSVLTCMAASAAIALPLSAPAGKICQHQMFKCSSSTAAIAGVTL